MRATVDTNVLVRAAIGDDEKQSEAATDLLRTAEIVAVSGACLCEFVWVLKTVYRLPRADRAAAVRWLLGAANVAVNRPGAEAGLVTLEAGGDFADGMIAHEGALLGGEIFVSFDKRAVDLLARQGQEALRLNAAGRAID